MREKNSDFIIANDISQKGVGFNADYNEVSIIDQKGNVEKISQQLVYFRKYSEEFSILGPVEAPINLLKGQFRYRILLKGKSRKNLNIFTKKMVSSVKIPSAVRVVIDVDPYTFM